MTYKCSLNIKSMETPTTLDEALKCFEEMKEALAEFEERVESAESNVEVCRQQAADDAGDAEYALINSLESIACILQKLKCGRTSEAISDLDRALQEYDCGGKARVAAVAVML